MVSEQGPTVRDARRALTRHGPATRKGLAERLGCTPAVARRLLDDLIGEGVVRNSRTFEMTGKRGRPAPIFELVPARPRAVAVALASGASINLAVDVRPVKGRNKPVRGVTMDEIAAPTSKARDRRSPSPGRKQKRRKGKLGVDEMLKVADELGYTASRTKKGHYKFEKPGSPPIFAPGSPSDWRSVKNVVSDLRAAA